MNFLKADTGRAATVFLSTGGIGPDHGRTDQQRDVDQQRRIEQGLQSGALSTKEAGSLNATSSTLIAWRPTTLKMAR